MMRVSAGEFQRQWGKVQDMAIAEPVTITSNGRDRVVLLSVEEYSRLKKRDREVMTITDFTSEDLKALYQMQASEESEAFNHEMKD